MPRDLVIQGVLLPAAAATAFLLASLLVGAVLRSKAQRRTDASFRGSGGALRRWAHERFDGAAVVAPAIAIAFLLSLDARGGAWWPPMTAWEWIAPLVAVAAGVAWLLPRRPMIWMAPIIAGAVAAWALVLPGFERPSQRCAIGIAVVVVAAALAWSARREDRGTRAARASELLTSTVAFTGLSLVVMAGAFGTLATALAAVACALAVATLAACFARTLRLGAAGAVTAGTLLVAGAATGAAYGTAELPLWHWPVAVAAPLLALIALIADRSRSPERPTSARRALLRIVIVTIVSVGNGVAALGPLIARGDFPPLL